MASTNKTSLGFNQWIGSDKPKWADFNADNRLIDAELKKRAEIGSDGLLKQDAKNAKALGGKDYSLLFDVSGAAKNALSFNGRTYSKLFNESGAAQNAVKFNGKNYSDLFDAKGNAVSANNTLKLGGVDAAKYVTSSVYTPALINGFKNILGGSTIQIVKIGNVVTISGVIQNSTASSNDRAAFIIPEELRPTYTISYEHYKTTGNAWIREWNGEFMIKSNVNYLEIYLTYILN